MLLQRIEQLVARATELEALLADVATRGEQQQYQQYAKELAELTPIVRAHAALSQMQRELSDLRKLMVHEARESEMGKLYGEEEMALRSKIGQLEQQLETLVLASSDARSGKDLIVEIRAGTGGEEAALFASDLFRMYSRYAANHHCKIDVMNTNVTGRGGFKEIIFGVSGRSAYDHLRFESGIHRVQRIPATEASGRIHTSAVTVAVLPEPDEVEITINPKDLRIDVFRSSGPGGQSVNTTDSAVRITHVPTGLVVTCQDEKSQHKNKAQAMRVLRARLLEQEQMKQATSMAQDRKRQVGSGDRSGKIRTYNFPDRRVTDHRIGLTLHALDDILEGHLDALVNALTLHEREEQLRTAERKAS